MVRVSLGTKGIDVDWKEGGNPVKPPPKGLEPHGDSGWYHSPDVVDPRDCQFYPDSPWCGGNPIDIGVEIGAEINVDPCGFTIDISGSTLIKFPHRVETYRLPGACRREYEKPPDAVLPPDIAGEDYRPPPFQLPSGFGSGEQVVVAVAYQIFYAEEIWGDVQQAYAIATETWNSSGSNLQNPSKYLYAGRNGEFGAPKPANCSVDWSNVHVFTANDLWTHFYGGSSTTWTSNGFAAIDSRQSLMPKSGGGFWSFTRGGFNSAFEYDSNTVNIYEGTFGDIEEYLKPSNGVSQEITEGTDRYGTRYRNRKINITELSVLYCIRKNGNDYSRNPPTLAPDPRNCCMQCCSSLSPQQQNNDDLLKKIYALLQQVDKNLGHAPIRVSIFDQNENAQEAQSTTLSLGSVVEALPKIVERIEKVSKIIGIDALPLTVPETISDPVNDNILEAVWDWLTPDATRKINNLFEWNVWMLEQFSSVMGHWQQEITVEDTDVLQSGDQGVPSEGGTTKKKIVLTDIATTLKEQTMLQLQLYKTLGLTLDVCLKTLTEGSSNAQQIAAIKAEINEIIDFLDYPTDDGYVDCPVQITVPGVDVSQEEQNDLAKFLKPTHSKVKYQNWNGKESLRDRFIHLATLLSRPQH